MGELLRPNDQLQARVATINLADFTGEPSSYDDLLHIDEYADIYSAVLQAMGIETIGQLKDIHDYGTPLPTTEQRRRFVAEMTAMELSRNTSIFPIDLQLEQDAGPVKLNPYYTWQYDNDARTLRAFAVFYNESTGAWLGLPCRKTDNISQFESPNTTTPEWVGDLVSIEDGAGLVDFLIAQKELMTGVPLSTNWPTSD